jgi:chaperone modulatory protein CbpM
MTEKNPSAVSGELVVAGAICTLDELCTVCNAPADWIAELVEHGVVEPLEGGTQSEWTFTGVSIVRVAKAKRLERDLNLNAPGVALVLELLDQIEDLRERLKGFDGLNERK